MGDWLTDVTIRARGLAPDRHAVEVEVNDLWAWHNEIERLQAERAAVIEECAMVVKKVGTEFAGIFIDNREAAVAASNATFLIERAIRALAPQQSSKSE